MASGHARRTKQVEHMAAPTKARCIKKALANGEPSTHGAYQKPPDVLGMSEFECLEDMAGSYGYFAE